MATRTPRGAIIRLVGSLAAVFILSQFYRTAVAVIAPDLVRDPGLSAQELGALTGAFFFRHGGHAIARRRVTGPFRPAPHGA